MAKRQREGFSTVATHKFHAETRQKCVHGMIAGKVFVAVISSDLIDVVVTDGSEKFENEHRQPEEHG